MENNMEKEKIQEAMKWYKRKLAISEDINIEDIVDEDIENVEILTEKNK
jgi:hypothetical protein